ncbi:MAG: transposase [Thaumarchaeota archaeon]|nr:transposase [Nitrososphaerota archaeon]
MLTYDRLAKRSSTFKSFIGLDVDEFDSLYEKVESGYVGYERQRLLRENRKRMLGAGRPFKLSLRDRLMMLLVYYRLYVTSILVGYLFNLDQSNVLKDVRMIEPLVERCIPIPKKVYARARRARTVEEVEEYFPGFKAIIDATEQEVPRPKNKRRRKSYYSGKKRRHTVKTQLTVNKDGLIMHKTSHVRGRVHDYTLYKEKHPNLPEQVNQTFDLGYYGVKNDFSGLNCSLPFKRQGGRNRKGRELTSEQRRFNRKLSKVRVVVEHTIARMKKFRIIGDEFRNRLKRYDRATSIVSGLVNIRIIGSGNIHL